MNRFNVQEYRRLSGYTYEPEPETPRQQVQTPSVRPVVEQRAAPKTQVASPRMSVRQEIRDLKTRLAKLEERVEVVQEDVRVVRQDQHGLKSLIEETRGQVRTVYLPQEQRIIYRDRPTPASRATSPAAAQMEAAIRQAPAPAQKPKEPEPPRSRFSLLEVD